MQKSSHVISKLGSRPKNLNSAASKAQNLIFLRNNLSNQNLDFVLIRCITFAERLLFNERLAGTTLAEFLTGTKLEDFLLDWYKKHVRGGQLQPQTNSPASSDGSRTPQFLKSARIISRGENVTSQTISPVPSSQFGINASPGDTGAATVDENPVFQVLGSGRPSANDQQLATKDNPIVGNMYINPIVSVLTIIFGVILDRFLTGRFRAASG